MQLVSLLSFDLAKYLKEAKKRSSKKKILKQLGVIIGYLCHLKYLSEFLSCRVGVALLCVICRAECYFNQVFLENISTVACPGYQEPKVFRCSKSRYSAFGTSLMHMGERSLYRISYNFLFSFNDRYSLFFSEFTSSPSFSLGFGYFSSV